MQILSATFQGILDSRSRDFVEVVEFYLPTYGPGASGFDPAFSSKRFAPITLTWNSLAYQRQLLKRSSVSRFMGKSFNTSNLTFSNVDRTLAQWINSTDIEGYRVVIRII